MGVCPGAHLVPPQVNHLGRCPSSWFWPHFQGVRAKCAGVQSSPWVFYQWEGGTSWPLRGGSCCPGPLQGNSRCRQARNAGRFKHCPCTAGCTAQPHPPPKGPGTGSSSHPKSLQSGGLAIDILSRRRTFDAPAVLPGRSREAQAGWPLPACPAPTALFCTRCSSCSAITLSPWAHFVWGWGVDSWTGCL